jgi:hypothetical protein
MYTFFRPLYLWVASPLFAMSQKHIHHETGATHLYCVNLSLRTNENGCEETSSLVRRRVVSLLRRQTPETKARNGMWLHGAESFLRSWESLIRLRSTSFMGSRVWLLCNRFNNYLNTISILLFIFQLTRHTSIRFDPENIIKGKRLQLSISCTQSVLLNLSVSQR